VIPLRDDVPSQTTPFVTYGLIALNVVVYLYQFSLSLDSRGPGAEAFEAFIMEFGAVPCRITGACTTVDQFPHPAATILTSMFLHANLLHVLGNMLYLWIFGDNVEDTLGHGRFLVFYGLSGLAAALGQTLVNPTSRVPMVGASGAVAGVLGAYLILFPGATVLTLMMFGIFYRIVHIPAVIVLGFWIVIQIVSGYLTVALGRGESGGVAWFAHIGGFVAGMLLLFLFRPRQSRRL
jgi:membrane associated rhomboid family serine protease